MAAPGGLIKFLHLDPQQRQRARQLHDHGQWTDVPDQRDREAARRPTSPLHRLVTVASVGNAVRDAVSFTFWATAPG